MIGPRKEDVTKFEGYDLDGFERWLRVGLEGLLIDGLGVRTFHPFEYCIWREHSLAVDLRNIYQGFSAERQSLIRAAIARLLDRLPVETKYVPLFRTLLDLSALVGAHEIFDVIPARGQKFLSLERDHPELPSLYKHAVDVVVELSDRSRSAKECITRLIGTPGGFNLDHARTALVALCRIAPEDFSEHVALLREPLAQNFQKFSPTSAALNYLAEDIVGAVGLEIVYKKWSRLRIVESPTIGIANDNWFRDAVVPQLSSISHENGAIIVVTAKPDIRINTNAKPFSRIRRRTSSLYYRAFSRAKKMIERTAPYPALPTEHVTQEERTANSQSIRSLLLVPSDTFDGRGV